MNWAVRLIGEEDDLRNLMSLNNPQLSIFYENGYYMRSCIFDEYQQPDDVYNKASQYLRIINGIASINLNLQKVISLDSIVRLDEENRILRTFNSSDLLGQCCVRTSLNNKNLENNQVARWINLAVNNENIAKVFRLISYGLNDFVNFYRIYEIIDNDMGKSLPSEWAISNDQIRRFKRTANHPESCGDLARHGVMSTQPVSNPMSVGDAYCFIYEIVYQWIHYHLSRQS